LEGSHGLSKDIRAAFLAFPSSGGPGLSWTWSCMAPVSARAHTHTHTHTHTPWMMGWAGFSWGPSGCAVGRRYQLPHLVLQHWMWLSCLFLITCSMLRSQSPSPSSGHQQATHLTNSTFSSWWRHMSVYMRAHTHRTQGPNPMAFPECFSFGMPSFLPPVCLHQILSPHLLHP
jgi:hypothetical protein